MIDDPGLVTMLRKMEDPTGLVKNAADEIMLLREPGRERYNEICRLTRLVEPLREKRRRLKRHNREVNRACLERGRLMRRFLDRALEAEREFAILQEKTARERLDRLEQQVL